MKKLLAACIAIVSVTLANPAVAQEVNGAIDSGDLNTQTSADVVTSLPPEAPPIDETGAVIVSDSNSIQPRPFYSQPQLDRVAGSIHVVPIPTNSDRLEVQIPLQF